MEHYQFNSTFTTALFTGYALETWQSGIRALLMKREEIASVDAGLFFTDCLQLSVVLPLTVGWLVSH